MKYVIIGNSIAATAAIEGIRSLDQTGPITVVSEERDHIYGRPLISYWLEEKVSHEQMFYRDPSFYEKNGVEVLLGIRATKINPRTQKVTLSSGKVLSYDRLLISCGGKPIVPPLPGLTEQNHSCFFNYQQVRDIKNQLQPGQKVAVLGGGLTGLKAAESLVGLGVEVSLIELADRLLGTIMNQAGSRLVADYLEQKGVRLYLGNTIERIDPVASGLYQLRLKDGTILDSNFLVMAIGVSPRIELLKESGLKLNRGVLVDRSQRTSIPEIYAAGDVAEVPDYLTGQPVVAPILPNAYTQGKIAGVNLAGGQEVFAGSLAYNAIGFLGLHTVSIGQSNLEAGPGLEILEEADPAGFNYRRLVLKEGRLIGAIFIGSIGRAGLYHDLIRDRTELAPFKEQLLKPDFGLIDLPEELYLKKLAQ